MAYSDPCANDPAHGLAVVGINPPRGEPIRAWWVCMACFEDYLGGQAALAGRLLHPDGEPDAH